MKYEKTLSVVNSGMKSRAELGKIRLKAEAFRSDGDLDAQKVLEAINIAVPSDKGFLFMGFCVDGNFDNRKDLEWKTEGVCRFTYVEHERQLALFQTICAGDVVVLKKNHERGKTMKLFGHGKVEAVDSDENGRPYLIMNWSPQDEIIEVPLMACGDTVNLKSLEKVEEEMPDEFFTWLAEK